MNLSKTYNILFSSWVFCWAVAYCFVREFLPQIPLDTWDPTFALLVAISYQFYALLHVLFRAKLSLLPVILAKYAIIITVVKLIPLYFVWRHKVNWTNSSISFAVLFLVYCAYITQQNRDVFEIYDELTESFVHNNVRLFATVM